MLNMPVCPLQLSAPLQQDVNIPDVLAANVPAAAVLRNSLRFMVTVLCAACKVTLFHLIYSKKNF
jgi:hypothetical protein